VGFAGRPVEDDVSPGAWIAAALHPGLDRVASLVPPVFAAYARVFHPAVRYDGDDDVEVGWAEVAAANGRRAHPGMQWPAVTGAWDYLTEDAQPGLWDNAPADGHLPEGVAERLAAVLARHTTTPDDCWFGVWHGHGFITADAPTLVLPGREHWLVRGPVALAAANMADEPWEQSAGLWWPADRAWLVATDLDLMSTFVGGTARCVADLVATPGLEAAEVDADAPLGLRTDAVNPPPD
jgi:hypothetical protein